MNEKLNILQCLIANRAFAPSHSALAGILGYKGKMTVYRLMRGQIREGTVEEVWNRLQPVYIFLKPTCIISPPSSRGRKNWPTLSFLR